MLGATYRHIRQTLFEANYTPYNFLTIFSDGFITIWLLVLLYLYWRAGGFEPQVPSRRAGARLQPCELNSFSISSTSGLLSWAFRKAAKSLRTAASQDVSFCNCVPRYLR
jgi:hypothetical protein